MTEYCCERFEKLCNMENLEVNHVGDVWQAIYAGHSLVEVNREMELKFEFCPFCGVELTEI